MSRRSLVPCVLLLSACPGPVSAVIVTETPVAQPSEPEPVTEPTPPPRPPAPGPILALGGFENVTRIGVDGHIEILQPEDADDDEDLGVLDDLIIDQQGKIFATADFGLYEVGESTLIPYLELPESIQSMDTAIFGPDGSLWVANAGGIYHRVGERWDSINGDGLLDRPRAVAHLGIDHADRLWMTYLGADWEARVTFRSHGEPWRPIDLSAVAIGPEASFFRSADGFYLHFDSDLVIADEPPAIHVVPMPGALSMGIGPAVQLSNGDFVLTADCNMVRLDPHEPEAATVLLGETLRACSGTTDSLAVDGNDRLWLFSDAGLEVIGPDMTPLASYPMGTIPALAETFFAARADNLGPTTLPPAGPVQHARLLATVVFHDVPMANTPVEFCRYYDSDSNGDPSPCDGAFPAYSGKTDRNGRLQIDGVQYGAYHPFAKITVKVDGKTTTRWHWGAPFGMQMAVDGVIDLGSLDFYD